MRRDQQSTGRPAGGGLSGSRQIRHVPCACTHEKTGARPARFGQNGGGGGGGDIDPLPERPASDSRDVDHRLVIHADWRSLPSTFPLPGDRQSGVLVWCAPLPLSLLKVINWAPSGGAGRRFTALTMCTSRSLLCIDQPTLRGDGMRTITQDGTRCSAGDGVLRHRPCVKHDSGGRHRQGWLHPANSAVLAAGRRCHPPPPFPQYFSLSTPSWSWDPAMHSVSVSAACIAASKTGAHHYCSLTPTISSRRALNVTDGPGPWDPPGPFASGLWCSGSPPPTPPPFSQGHFPLILPCGQKRV